ncbi:MAG TPA: hypothetical protein DEP35_07035 [Deltaproteobacteria bacterium]|nr:hypothetical protein [Deltaproteobacteria bacterium]
MILLVIDPYRIQPGPARDEANAARRELERASDQRRNSCSKMPAPTTNSERGAPRKQGEGKAARRWPRGDGPRKLAN